MRHWFTARDAPIERDTVKRFDPLHWTVDFPRGAMASVVTTSDGHGLSVEASFLRANDLVGLIWKSADDRAHPAHARETSRDAPIEQDNIKRFDPLHWTVDFPRGAMASVVTSSDGHGLSVEASFLRANDLVGLIWTSEDAGAHPAHARETSQ